MNKEEIIASLTKKEDGYCLYLVSDQEVLGFKEEHLTALINLLKSGRSFDDYEAYDTVVGKAAAAIFLKLKVKSVYALLLSDSAFALLKKHNVDVDYQTKVPFIINRQKTGLCPMEEALLNVEDHETMIETILKKEKELKNNLKITNVK